MKKIPISGQIVFLIILSCIGRGIINYSTDQMQVWPKIACLFFAFLGFALAMGTCWYALYLLVKLIIKYFKLIWNYEDQSEGDENDEIV